MILLVVVGGRGDDHELRAAVGRGLVGGHVQAKLALPFSRLPEKGLDLLVPDRTDEPVEPLGFGRRGGDGRDVVLLGEQDGHTIITIAPRFGTDKSSGRIDSPQVKIGRRPGMGSVSCKTSAAGEKVRT